MKKETSSSNVSKQRKQVHNLEKRKTHEYFQNLLTHFVHFSHFVSFALKYFLLSLCHPQ